MVMKGGDAVPSDFFDQTEPRLVCTADMVRKEHRRNVLLAGMCDKYDDAMAPKWYKGIIAEAAQMEPIELGRGAHWCLDAPRLQGRVPHRAVFEGALAAIYGRMLDEHSECNS